MPFVNISVSKKLEAAEKESLYAAIAENISILPGKNIANTTVCVNDGCAMFNNGQPIESVFIDVRLFKASPEENKRAFADKLYKIVEETLKIPTDRAQFNFSEMPAWCSGGSYWQ